MAGLISDPGPRWRDRCGVCGNPRHFLFRFIVGWMAWHLVCDPWMRLTSRRLPPFLATAGDWLFDQRGCRH